MAIISVYDNGKGVPSNFLGRLTEKGFSHGKKDGHGLGLFQAKNWIESISGKIYISSVEGKETRVLLRIPVATPPNHILTSLKAARGNSFVVIDDDPAMRELWKSRLQPLAIDIQFFTNFTHFEEWFKQANQAAIAQFVVDYEFSGQSQTGLDLIKSFGLEKRGFLVTSYYQEPQVVKGAEALGIQILPKPLVSYVPITVEDAHDAALDGVLVDDDPMNRFTWSKAADRAGKKLAVYSSADELRGSLEQVPVETPMYVDVLLANGESGIELAKELIGRGYSKVFLTTGMQTDQLPEVSGLTGVVGKQPCFG